jgi:hypothetical protein
VSVFVRVPEVMEGRKRSRGVQGAQQAEQYPGHGAAMPKSCWKGATQLQSVCSEARRHHRRKSNRKKRLGFRRHIRGRAAGPLARSRKMVVRDRHTLRTATGAVLAEVMLRAATLAARMASSSGPKLNWFRVLCSDDYFSPAGEK